MSKRNGVRIAVISAVVLLVAGVVFLKLETVAAADSAGGNETPVEEAGKSRALNTGSRIPDDPLETTVALDLDTLRSYGVPVIIDFGSESCAPCRQMAPILAELHDSLRGKAIIRYVDVWKYQNLAEGFPLTVIPTQFFFDAEGKPFSPSESLGIPFTLFKSRETDEHALTRHEGGLTKDELLAIVAAMGGEL